MTRFAFDPVLIPRLVVWVLLFGLLTITRADPDLWGHVKFGRDIAQDRAIASVDSYSFTSDRTWINHEWLAELLMGGAYTIGGALALGLLKASVLVFGFALVGLELRRQRLDPLPADLLLAAAVVGSFFATSTVRPQIFSVLLFTALLCSLVRADEGWRPALAVVPIVMAVWANVHGGWLVGIGVLGLWASIRIAVPIGLSRADWTGLGAIGLLATLITPYGWGLWLFLRQTVGFGRVDISEWQPVYRSPPEAWALWALPVVVTVVAFVRSPVHRPTTVAVLLMLGVASFRVVRLIPFLAIASVVLLAPSFQPNRARRVQSPASGLVAAVVLATCIIAALIGAAEFARRNLSCIDSDEPWSPDQRAAAYVNQAGFKGRLLIWFDWGEYAIWHFAPRLTVSMDGRRETVYSERTLRRLYGLFDAAPGWQDDLAALAPQVAWLRPDLPLAAKLESIGWRRAFVSSESVVLTVAPPPDLAPPAITAPRCFPQ